jgi:hypothetical protein
MDRLLPQQGYLSQASICEAGGAAMKPETEASTRPRLQRLVRLQPIRGVIAE